MIKGMKSQSATNKTSLVDETPAESSCLYRLLNTMLSLVVPGLDLGQRAIRPQTGAFLKEDRFLQEAAESKHKQLTFPGEPSRAVTTACPWSSVRGHGVTQGDTNP